MKTAILTIVLFCIMIFPHELGHFLAAKKMGVQVNEFAFGMGPTIWKKQRGETLHSIRLFPIGGFCAMEGEDEDSDNPRAFGRKKPWQRIVILAAGSFMNLVCALVISWVLVGMLGFTTTTVGTVSSDGPAMKAGLAAGDKIVRIDETEIKTWNDVSAAIAAAEGKPLSFTVQSDGEARDLTITPQLMRTQDANGQEMQYYAVGITCRISHNPLKAITAGTQATWNMMKSMFTALGDLASGRADADDLSGPVGMVQMVSRTSEYGWSYYGFLTILICLNLAVINMLPLPALDGGRIIFVLFTMITGRKVSERVEGTVHIIGLVLLMGLMIYVTKNDIFRLIG